MQPANDDTQTAPELLTTRDLYDRLKSLSGKETAYGVAKYFGWQQNTVRRWEKGHATLDEESVRAVSAALGLDPGYVALCMAAERTQSDILSAQMRAWISTHAGTAAALFFAVFTVLFSPDARADQGANARLFLGDSLYIMRTAARARALVGRLRRPVRTHPRTAYRPS